MIILNHTRQTLQVSPDFIIPAQGHIERSADQVRPHVAVLRRWSDANTTDLAADGTPVKRITVTGGALPKVR